MDFNKFLEEYNELDIKDLEREQLEKFRSIFVEYGVLDKALEISELIYENNKDDEAAIVSYVDNLMHLNKRDDALIVLYNSKKTSQTLFLEGIIYKEDMLFDVAEEKFKKALELVEDDEELENIIKYELANIYKETEKVQEALEINYNLFNENKTERNLENLLDVLLYLGKYEEVIQLYQENEKKLSSADIHFAVAYAHNQLEEFDKSKKHLLKTIELDPDFSQAYLGLGNVCKGQEAIKYLEKFIELEYYATGVYLRLVQLYKDEEQYDKIREMVRDLLQNRGIDFDTLHIAITALHTLYETEKIYEIYKNHNLIKEDSSLLALTLSSLLEEEEYVDFVLEEVKKHHPFLKEEITYYEILKNLYELTGDLVVKIYLQELEQDKEKYFENNEERY